jgi:hypothetical protein
VDEPCAPGAGLAEHQCPGGCGDAEREDSAPTPAELLATPGAFLTRRHLRDLGLTRTAIDAVFRELDVVFYPGQKRGGAVLRDDFVALTERCTYGADRVRPT